MSDQLIDLTPHFLAFWEKAQDRTLEEQQRLWSERYESPHQHLFAVCGGRHGTPEVLPAALRQFPGIVPHLPETIAQVRAAIERAGPTPATLFAFDQLDLRWVLVVGMFWSDGWVFEIDGQPTCFIAVEMLTPAEAARIAILLAH
jgi:hypothetical protein